MLVGQSLGGPKLFPGHGGDHHFFGRQNFQQAQYGRASISAFSAFNFPRQGRTGPFVEVTSNLLSHPGSSPTPTQHPLCPVHFHPHRKAHPAGRGGLLRGGGGDIGKVVGFRYRPGAFSGPWALEKHKGEEGGLLHARTEGENFRLSYVKGTHVFRKKPPSINHGEFEPWAGGFGLP